MMQKQISLIALALVLLPAPVLAQGVVAASQTQVNQIDKRVSTLESQMRAVQRQVFPGGDKRFFTPEITAPTTPEPAPSAVAAGPVVELTQRVTALETQQRELTGTIEELQHKLRQMETAFQKLRGDTEFRLNALEAPHAVDPLAGPATPVAPVPAPVAAPAAPAKTPAELLEAQYQAGYDLYTKKNYAAAETSLLDFAVKNPKHARASNAQFWAGRAMLEQKKTAAAAKAFLEGYQKFPKGERAHNSLLYLGKALLEMKQPEAACQALDQLQTAYPAKITGSFATDVTKTRASAGCS